MARSAPRLWRRFEAGKLVALGYHVKNHPPDSPKRTHTPETDTESLLEMIARGAHACDGSSRRRATACCVPTRAPPRRLVGAGGLCAARHEASRRRQVRGSHPRGESVAPLGERRAVCAVVCRRHRERPGDALGQLGLSHLLADAAHRARHACVLLAAVRRPAASAVECGLADPARRLEPKAAARHAGRDRQRRIDANRADGVEDPLSTARPAPCAAAPCAAAPRRRPAVNVSCR